MARELGNQDFEMDDPPGFTLQPKRATIAGGKENLRPGALKVLPGTH